MEDLNEREITNLQSQPLKPSVTFFSPVPWFSVCVKK